MASIHNKLTIACDDGQTRVKKAQRASCKVSRHRAASSCHAWQKIQARATNQGKK